MIIRIDTYRLMNEEGVRRRTRRRREGRSANHLGIQLFGANEVLFGKLFITRLLLKIS